jgi:C2 domain
VRTRTIDNNLNPEWNQTFSMLVDDLGSQSLCECALLTCHLTCTHYCTCRSTTFFIKPLKCNAAMLKLTPTYIISRDAGVSLLLFPVAAFVVKDDDLGFEDDVLGAYEIELDDAEFIMRPREAIPMTLQLLEADDSGFINDMKAMSRAVRTCFYHVSALTQMHGMLCLAVALPCRCVTLMGPTNRLRIQQMLRSWPVSFTCQRSILQGPKQMKKLKPRVPGSKKKKAAKKARKAVSCNGALREWHAASVKMLQHPVRVPAS